MSHTPGPWEVISLQTNSPFSKEWRGISPHVVQPAWYTRDGEPEIGVQIAEADARLIAAAPDLLALLCEGVALHREAHVIGAMACDFDERARAAIAKARGEQP